MSLRSLDSELEDFRSQILAFWARILRAFIWTKTGSVEQHISSTAYIVITKNGWVKLVLVFIFYRKNLRLILFGVYWPSLLKNLTDNSLSYRLSAKQSLSHFIISSCRRSVGWHLKESSFIFYSSKSFGPRLGQQETKLCSCCVAGVSFLCNKSN